MKLGGLLLLFSKRQLILVVDEQGNERFRGYNYELLSFVEYTYLRSCLVQDAVYFDYFIKFVILYF